MNKKLLGKLEELQKEKNNNVFLKQGTDAATIDKIQTENGFILPFSFYTFLRKYNGGFISIVDKSDSYDIQEWNSNLILGIEEIGKAYKSMRYKFDDNTDEIFIPFLHADTGEYLGFMNPLSENESKVYDLWHETFPHDWKEMDIYDSFEELLDDYVDNMGEIATIG